jgi:hypothetical protein
MSEDKPVARDPGDWERLLALTIVRLLARIRRLERALGIEDE